MPWSWRTRDDDGRFTLRAEVPIDAPVGDVYRAWIRYEELPRVLESVRRATRVGDGRVLWDVDVAGRQVVWEAWIVACEPEQLIRWESTWGATHEGEVRFEERAGNRSTLAVCIRYRPRSFVERLGARLGLVDLHVRRDLELFRRSIESQSKPEQADER
ncbi:MAG: SRPBCC family protein [Myxococcota bacterium]